MTQSSSAHPAPQSPYQAAVWLTAARWLWIGLALILVGVYIAGLPFLFENLASICLQEPCPPLTLTQQDYLALQELGLSLNFYAWYLTLIDLLAAGALTSMAFLIFWRKSDEWIGILVALALLLFGLIFIVESDGALVLAYPLLKLPHLILTSMSAVLFVGLLFVFPDGQFIPGWTRWVAAGLTVLALLDPFLGGFMNNSAVGEVGLVFSVGILACSVVGLYAQMHRYRSVSDAIERQQTKWVVFGLAMAVLIMFSWILLFEFFPPQPGLPTLVFNLPVYGVMAMFLIVFPITIGISILRYRLWDIDVLIRRTLVYGVLTVLLALLYFVSVSVLQNLLVQLSGQRSPVSVVLSTLAIASLFSPLRRGIQNTIDRRFYRQKYDAEKALVGFAHTARENLDLEHLSGAMQQVVEDTMQPDTVSIWFRPRGKKGQGRFKEEN